MSEWRGQNQRTLTVGLFPATLTQLSLPPVAVPPGPNPTSTSALISAPLKGSLQHVSHGDIKPERCWGTPENLDESVTPLIHSSLFLVRLLFIVYTKPQVYHCCFVVRKGIKISV